MPQPSSVLLNKRGPLPRTPVGWAMIGYFKGSAYNNGTDVQPRIHGRSHIFVDSYFGRCMQSTQISQTLGYRHILFQKFQFLLLSHGTITTIAPVVRRGTPGAAGSVTTTFTTLDNGMEVLNRQVLHLFQRQSLRASRQSLDRFIYKGGTIILSCGYDLSNGVQTR